MNSQNNKRTLSNIEENDPVSFESLSDEEIKEILSIEYEEEVPITPKQDDEYRSNGETFDISFIEFAMLNKYLHALYRNETFPLRVKAYGKTDSIGRINYGGVFDLTQGWWFEASFDNDTNSYIFQTKIYLDNRGDIITQLHMTVKTGITSVQMDELFKKVLKMAFNNSEYVGTCIKVKIKDGRFKGIEIINIEDKLTDLVLSETQQKYMEKFISGVRRGKSIRYLLNGEPGTGKTESIRDAIRELVKDKVTFIIPDFSTTEDLTVILEACEVFDKGVIIMDDVDLYLGSRANGSYTKLLGEFLAFFDGVKKRKVSLLASTNDKGLVDKAAERPGRFNMTLDYTFLNEEQIVRVCNIHLPKEYQVPEVYKVLCGNVSGKKAKITGAFIANLADNVMSMSEGDDTWTLKDTLSLITELYKGFYTSQTEKENGIGFKTN